MADDFKALVALTKQTNAKLELLHRQGEEDGSPKERILDALPEILSMERVMNKEKAQRAKLQKQDEAAEGKHHKEQLKEDGAERKKQSKDISTPIVSVMTDLNGRFTLTGLGLEKSNQSFKERFINFMNKPLTIKQGKEDSRTAEQKKKAEKRQDIFNKGLKGLGDGIKTLARKGFDKVKSGLSGFAKFAMGGLALAALAFINDPVFQKMAFDFTEYIIPRLAYVYKEYIKPLGTALKDFVVDLDAVFKGEKTWFDLLKGNKAVSVAIAAIFGGSLFVSIFSIAGSMALKLLGFIGKGAFMTALAVNPAILKGIGLAGIAVGLYNLAIDGIDEYNKTQDVSKAFSTALAGKGKDMSGAFANMAKGKFSALLGGAGMFLGPMGAVVGFGIGLMIDGILGYFGAEAIDNAIGTMKDDILKIIDDLTSFIQDFVISAILGTKSFMIAPFGGTLSKEEQAEQARIKKAGNNAADIVETELTGTVNTLKASPTIVSNFGKAIVNAANATAEDFLSLFGVKQGDFGRFEYDPLRDDPAVGPNAVVSLPIPPKPNPTQKEIPPSQVIVSDSSVKKGGDTTTNLIKNDVPIANPSAIYNLIASEMGN